MAYDPYYSYDYYYGSNPVVRPCARYSSTSAADRYYYKASDPSPSSSSPYYYVRESTAPAGASDEASDWEVNIRDRRPCCGTTRYRVASRPGAATSSSSSSSASSGRRYYNCYLDDRDGKGTEREREYYSRTKTTYELPSSGRCSSPRRCSVPGCRATCCPDCDGEGGAGSRRIRSRTYSRSSSSSRWR
ncbi:hypothetical protein MKZ38_009028 [Zalerion maritima]|uniref:Uncharacterized protein n=1 Tax=Zalerion maritima TaxID=339359 RepID=A0AAD5WUW5_9PEZI|nr:hypothetical protein MKZ38_009028 [Zalerion maritima]